MHDHVDALNAIVNVHEAARLLAISPDCDFVLACIDQVQRALVDLAPAG